MNQKKCEKYENLNPIVESTDTVFNDGVTTVTVFLTFIDVGIKVLPSSVRVTCALSSG